MSRREVKGDYGTIAYGVDHATGLFVQVWEGLPHDTTRDPDIDMDKMTHPHLTHELIINIADMEVGVKLTPEDFATLTP